MILQNPEPEKCRMKSSISKHFSIILTSVVIIILTLFSVTVILFNSLQLEKHLEDRLKYISGFAQTSLVSAIWQFDLNSINDFLDAILIDKDIAFVRVILADPDQMKALPKIEQITKTRQDFQNKDYEFFRGSHHFIAKQIDIIKTDQKIGRFQVAITKEIIRKQLQFNIVISITLIFFMITAILITSIAITRRYVFRPLAILADAAKRIADGDMDVSVTIDRNDEIGSLASDFNIMRESVKKANRQLEEYAKNLEVKVEERTEELNRKNTRLSEVNYQLEKTLEELRQSQAQLIESEKMAALGHLIAGIAHEINTPLGAIQASVSNITESLKDLSSMLRRIFQILSEEDQELFFAMIKHSSDSEEILSAKEERRIRRMLTEKLEEIGVDPADTIADTLTDMGIYNSTASYLPIFRHSEWEFILQTAYNLSRLKKNSQNITTAIDRASKVVFALKNYARFDQTQEKVLSNVTEGIETILTLYHNQLKKGIEIIRRYGDIPLIRCHPDELNQVWTNIIHNAIQAMDGKGILEIDVYRDHTNVVITFTDNGKGISDDIKDRIFTPFFTTKARGEGSGLGLHIVKKIIDKHSGVICMESIPGKTVFRIVLPI